MICFVVHDEAWSYGFNARGVAPFLGDVRIVEQPEEVGDADVAVDMYWGGTLDHPRLIRQVSSHRWSFGVYGRLSVKELVRRHLAAARVVIVPSRRLESLLSPYCPRVMRTPKGFDPERFFDRGGRSGPLAIGWAGAVKADKGLHVLKTAAPDLRIATSLSYAEMPEWYASVDVIACASVAEGDPRTLIEGMACGCFPVTVDVGIVPEIVEHGVSGLIVERSPRAFADAFAWCRKNAARVRAAGRRNADEMAHTRTWGHVAPAWAEAIERANRPDR